MTDSELPRGVAVPGEARVEAHFDGAAQRLGGRRLAAYGFVVEGGGFAHEEAGLAVPPDHPRATNNVAEYVGAIRALEWLVSAGYRGDVDLVGDSELVVRQMNGEYAVRAPHLGPYHERLLQLVGSFSHVEFRWVRREENERADALSKQGLAAALAVGSGGGRVVPGR